MKSLIEALERARHELVTLHGLLAADGAAPTITWSIDVGNVIDEIDAAIESSNNR
jgi:hypothetical protein